MCLANTWMPPFCLLYYNKAIIMVIHLANCHFGTIGFPHEWVLSAPPESRSVLWLASALFYSHYECQSSFGLVNNISRQDLPRKGIILASKGTCSLMEDPLSMSLWAGLLWSQHLYRARLSSYFTCLEFTRLEFTPRYGRHINWQRTRYTNIEFILKKLKE